MKHILEQLGIPESYGRSPALPHFDEPAELVDVGPAARVVAQPVDLLFQLGQHLGTQLQLAGGSDLFQAQGPGVAAVEFLGPNQLAYADFRGNTQLISTGNVSKNDRCSLILMDYPNRRRLKILGHMRVDGGRPLEASDLAKVELPEYKAQVERVVYIDVVAFDWNCPQRITRRYTVSEFEAWAEKE